MAGVELNEALLAKIAGWEAMKQARSLVERDAVLSAEWAPPVLRGVVRGASATYRAGLVIRDAINVENLCSCREAREWGTMCPHSIAVGVHYVRRQGGGSPEVAKTPVRSAGAPAASAPPAAGRLRRVVEGGSGEPLALHVILPPNLAIAFGKGKVMVCVEGECRGRRMPLDRVPTGSAYALSPEDAALLDQLERLGGDQTPALLLLSPTDLAGLLARLVEHPRVTLGRANRLAIRRDPRRLKVEASLEAGGEIVLRSPAARALAGVLPGDPGWVLDGTELRPLGLPVAEAGLCQGPVRIGRDRVPRFLSEDWPRLAATTEWCADFAPEDFVVRALEPAFRLDLAGGLAQLEARLHCAYGERVVALGTREAAAAFWLPDPDSPTTYATRDTAAEQAAVGRLVRAGFAGPDAEGRYRLQGQEAVVRFFAREYPALERAWQVTLEARLEQSAARNLERISPRFTITPSGEEWFDLKVGFATGDGAPVDAAEIQRLLRTGQSATRGRQGKLALLDTGALEEFEEVLRDCAPEQAGGAYRIARAQAGFLDATLRDQPTWSVRAPAAWGEWAARLSGEEEGAKVALGSLGEVLRPYQKDGVAWLGFLRAHGFGGLLADEMGLGKTVQVLAHLRAIRSGLAAGAARGPSLVVCPTSLVYNWQAEAARFTPELRVLALDGPQRSAQFGAVPEHDLVITSYALIRRDAERYRGWEFDTVVLDEAQHIKNRQTQNAQAVKALRARHRLVLTGTPLENSVLDVWSIFDFLMPGYLGSATDFRERYELPIVRERDAAVQARLARRLRPFLRRRTKREVAPELPPKLEQVAYCELTAEQAAVYAQLVTATRREVSDTLHAQGEARSRLIALNALLRLRQVCCDLRLLQLDGVRPETASGKVALCHELLQEAIDGGHRVLLFSQFVSMLTLLRADLDAQEVAYCYLDGSTVNRAEVIQRFQRDPAVPVFLISLKAGGTGLNLAAADTVIHFDPWWNPAVEAQATDRAHRLGQTRLVTSYKLIARGTVEEKILQLQRRKASLLEAMLGDEAAFTQSLSWAEIQELLVG